MLLSSLEKGEIKLFGKKTVLLFLLLFLLNNVCLAGQPISEQGFRDLQWGQSITEPEGENFVQLDFDRQKKLYNYVRRGEEPTIFEVDFYPIYYHFWEGKFFAVRAYFTGEKNSGAFEQIYNQLISHFGLPKQTGALDNEGEYTLWQVGDTGIRLSYNQLDTTGSLYIFNIPLQNQYVDFAKNIQPLTGYLNQPAGFADFSWGMTPEEFKAQNFKLRPNRNSDIYGDYLLAKDNKEFLGVPILRKTYDFADEQLYAVNVYFSSGDELYGELHQRLDSNFGPANYGRYYESENLYYYLWPGDKTYIILHYLPGEKESYLVLMAADFVT